MGSSSLLNMPLVVQRYTTYEIPAWTKRQVMMVLEGHPTCQWIHVLLCYRIEAARWVTVDSELEVHIYDLAL